MGINEISKNVSFGVREKSGTSVENEDLVANHSTHANKNVHLAAMKLVVNSPNVKHHCMVHTEYYGTTPYRPMVLQYSEILAYYWLFLNSSLYHTDSCGFVIHDWTLLQ